MKVKQVAVPMDFGVTNLKNLNHVNVKLLAANGRVVKANSLILSYNSRVFRNMFKKEESSKSVDLTEFPRHVIDKFVKALYSGKVDFERLPFTREIWQLADNFNVKWILKQLDLHLRDLIEERMHEPTFINIKYIFEEASYFKTKKRNYAYMEMATNKLNGLRNSKKVKKKFLKRYSSKFTVYNVNQINLLVDFAGEKGSHLLLKTIQEKVAKNNYGRLGRISRELLRRIDLTQCLKSDMDSFVAVFASKDKYRNLSPDQVDELRRLEEISTAKLFSERPNVRPTFVKKRSRFRDQNFFGNILDDGLPSTSSSLTGFGHSVSFPGSRSRFREVFELLDPESTPTLSISNPILRRKRPAKSVINIHVKRPRPDLDFNNPDLGDPDDGTVAELLDGTDKIPNMVYSFPEQLKTFQTVKRNQLRFPANRYRADYTLDDVLKFFKTSRFSFKNMYMFIEYVFLRKAVTLRPLEPSDAELVQYINDIIAIKQRNSWRKVSKVFVENIVVKLIAGPVKNLLKKMSDNEELTSAKEAAKIVSWRGARSESRSRKYYDYNTIRMGEFILGEVKKYKFFWKHPDAHECDKPGNCGFVLCVLPISKSFDIRLSTRPEDYSEDIHCHPEQLHSDHMHLVLRRDFSTKGKAAYCSQNSRLVHVTWQGKPLYHKNHVIWSGEHIPDNAYIALIVYYSFDSKCNSGSQIDGESLTLGPPKKKEKKKRRIQ